MATVKRAAISATFERRAGEYARGHDVGCSAINRVYNVACGETTSLNELFASIKNGLRAIVPSVGERAPVYEGFRQGDIRRSSANIADTRRLLGFEPTVAAWRTGSPRRCSGTRAPRASSIQRRWRSD